MIWLNLLRLVVSVACGIIGLIAATKGEYGQAAYFMVLSAWNNLAALIESKNA